MDSAMPCAITRAFGERPISVPAASVQPNTPISPVGWKPIWWNGPLPTAASRVAASTPAT